ncbi:MAG: LysM peptidoglycan-binding domain-containing protein [Kiritimatiellaeota bacterium]|nr:LysM peptidoglycan-binding domain-containing protein [Kiritimatiellota bacterium]
MKRRVIRIATGASFVVGCCLMQGCVRDRAEDVMMRNDPPIQIGEIPEDTPSVFAEQVKPPPVMNRVATTTPYVVKKDDTVIGIAVRYGLRWQDVIAVNPDINPNRLQIGQVIQLPGLVDLSKTATPRPALPKMAAPSRAETVYVVKGGDSISEIALKHGVKVEDIRKANDLKDVNKISIGQKLTIPGATKSVANVGAERPMPPKGTAPVAKSVEDQEKVTGADPVLPEKDVEKDVEKVKEDPVDLAPVSNSALEKHTVKEGDDLYSIAIRYGVSPSDLRAQNKLPSTEVRPGMVLEIPGGAQ